MFDEEKRREPGKDTLTAYHGLLGSYPNFLFNVPLDEVGDFTQALHAVRTREQFLAVINAYGLSRTHPRDLGELSLVRRLPAAVSPDSGGGI